MSGPTFAAKVALRPQTIFLMSVRNASRQVVRNDLKLFKEINELSRKGQWCSIKNSPTKYFALYDNSRAFAIHSKLLGVPKNWWQKYPHGQELAIVLTFVGFFVTVEAVYLAYNYFVPESYRYKFKAYHANVLHHLQDHHGHDDHEHGAHHGQHVAHVVEQSAAEHAVTHEQVQESSEHKE